MKRTASCQILIKKSKYDRFGHAGVDPNAGFGGGGFGGFGGGSGGFDDIFDMFGSMFGGGFGGGSASRKNGPMKGRDLQKAITIDFEEAAFGTKKEISINKYVQCPEMQRRRKRPRHREEDLRQLRRNGSGPYSAENAFWTVPEHGTMS